MVTHSNVVYNVQLMESCGNTSQSSVFVGWIPPYHDMGLIAAILQTIMVGCSFISFAPIDFIKKPHLWLEAVTKYRGTHIAAPNFGYELCVRKVTDVSNFKSLTQTGSTGQL